MESKREASPRERKPQLHEVLAVEPDLLKSMRKVIDEAKHTFKEKASHFVAWTKVYHSINEDDIENGRAENHEMTTTVDEKLDYISDFIVKAIDCTAQKEATNQKASAKLSIGVATFDNVPATLLLNLEHRTKELRELLNTIPTLQPGVDWQEDHTFNKDNVYKCHTPQETSRTKKTVRGVELSPATDRHPAQVEKVTEDVPIGKYVQTVWSGMITPAKKSRILGRLDEVEHAIKKARMRANTQAVAKLDIGRSLMDYIIKG